MIVTQAAYLHDSAGVRVGLSATIGGVAYPAIPLDADNRHYAAVMAAAAGGLKISEPSAPTAAAQLAARKVEAMEAAIRAIDRLTHPILAAYPEAERASWPTQEAEAWLVVDEGGTAVDAPMLAGIATASGRTLRAVADAVIEKSGQFAAVVAAAQRLRRDAEASIAAAGSVEAVNAALAAHVQACAAKAAALGIG